jgi:hypothetical protein
VRGRLIVPFFAELAQLDTVETAKDPDGAGDLTSGYDDDFRTVVKVSDGTAAGVDARQEKPAILVPCQVETRVLDMLRQIASGNAADADLILVFHFRDLENMGLVDPTTGKALIRTNDRLVAIRECPSGDLIEAIPNPPGLFVTEPRSSSFGLSGGARNLLVVTLKDREQGKLA